MTVKFRMRDTGTVVTIDHYREIHANKFLPASFSPDDADPIFEMPKPDIQEGQYLIEGPPQQTEKGDWIQTWLIQTHSPEVLEKIEHAKVERLISTITQATQDRLDAFARTRNYDNILSACTYATSKVTRFKAEGQYCVNARDATWAALYTFMEEVQGGTRAMPTSFSDVVSFLPTLEWPTA